MEGRRGRNRKHNLAEGEGGSRGGGKGREAETELLILWFAVLKLLVCGWWWRDGCLTICQTCLPCPFSG